MKTIIRYLLIGIGAAITFLVASVAIISLRRLAELFKPAWLLPR